MKERVKPILPWVAGVAIFVVASLVFYAPQFEGKSLGQGDIAQYAGMSQDIKAHREATGEDPQWTGNMFSGMPAYLIDVEYPTQDVIAERKPRSFSPAAFCKPELIRFMP